MNKPGINYGNDRAWSTYFDKNIIFEELSLIRKHFDVLRVFIPHYGYDNEHLIVKNCEYIIKIAVALGFTDIIWGTTCSESKLKPETYPQYVEACKARARLANKIGVTIFIVGNEEDYHFDTATTLTRAQVQDYMRNDLPTKIRSEFSGKISYNLPSGVLTDWINGGKGALDIVGLNVYGSDEKDTAGFIRDVNNFYTKFGATSYISEYGITWNWSTLTYDECEQYAELKKRYNHVKSKGFANYCFFLYSQLPSDHFGVRLKDGTYRKMWHAITTGSTVKINGH